MENELKIFKKILNTLPNSIYLKDMQGRYLWLNQASIKQLEYKHSIFDSIIGKTDFEVFPEFNAAEYVKNDQKVTKERRGVSTEEEVLLPSGQKLIQLSFKESLYDDGSSEPIGVLGYTSDITLEKQAQEALKQANQARLRFASTASHEVINHVSCVVSFAERLERNLTALQKMLPEEINAGKKTSEAGSVSRMLAETLEDCKDIRSAAEGGMTAIRNISDLQHMQLHKITTRPTRLGIQPFLDLIIGKSTYPNTHHIEIETCVHSSVPSEMILDLTNVMAAFGIVMGNAFRFSRPGGKIQVTVKKLLENKKTFLVISVQDFGVGMHQAQIKKLSMTLVEADAEPESLYAKPSVQLSRVKMYLEASEGRLEIESVLNQGTEVKLIVPYTLPVEEKSAEKK
jgi:PAS domain S-box-containing protein